MPEAPAGSRRLRPWRRRAVRRVCQKVVQLPLVFPNLLNIGRHEQQPNEWLHEPAQDESHKGKAGTHQDDGEGDHNQQQVDAEPFAVDNPATVAERLKYSLISVHDQKASEQPNGCKQHERYRERQQAQDERHERQVKQSCQSPEMAEPAEQVGEVYSLVRMVVGPEREQRDAAAERSGEHAERQQRQQLEDQRRCRQDGPIVLVDRQRIVEAAANLQRLASILDRASGLLAIALPGLRLAAEAHRRRHGQRVDRHPVLLLPLTTPLTTPIAASNSPTLANRCSGSFAIAPADDRCGTARWSTCSGRAGASGASSGLRRRSRPRTARGR